MSGAPAVLEGRGLCKNYGGLRAVVDVSFGVRAGEILGVAGPNGAGKTTMFDVISGLTPATSGDVLLDGKVITKQPVHVRARLGVARTFQHAVVADSLSVLENVMLAAAFRHRASGDDRSAAEVAGDVLRYVGLDGRVSTESSALNLVEKKLLMLGTALAGSARVLLLDEPFGGLNPHEIDQTIALIRQARETGLAVICIEHVMRALAALADRVLVMHHGAVFFEGTPQQMLADQRVVEVYLGSGHQQGAA